MLSATVATGCTAFSTASFSTCFWVILAASLMLLVCWRYSSFSCIFLFLASLISSFFFFLAMAFSMLVAFFVR